MGPEEREAEGRHMGPRKTNTLLMFWCVPIYKVIVLHHGDNFLFWHLYQIHTFMNNLNDEEMITSHFWLCITLYDKNVASFEVQLLC